MFKLCADNTDATLPKQLWLTFNMFLLKMSLYKLGKYFPVCFHI